MNLRSRKGKTQSQPKQIKILHLRRMLRRTWPACHERRWGFGSLNQLLVVDVWHDEEVNIDKGFGVA